MAIDLVFDIPAHPLLVHVPVVFVPLASAGAVAIALRPAWRRSHGWLVATAGVIGAIGTQLAAMSGEGLEDRIDPSAAVERHIDLAGVARPLVFVSTVVLLAFVVLMARQDRADVGVEAAEPDGATPAGGVRGGGVALAAGPTARRTKAVGQVLAALTIVTAVLATTWIIRAGHQGASATWKGTGEVQEGG